MNLFTGKKLLLSFMESKELIAAFLTGLWLQDQVGGDDLSWKLNGYLSGEVGFYK